MVPNISGYDGFKLWFKLIFDWWTENNYGGDQESFLVSQEFAGWYVGRIIEK